MLIFGGGFVPVEFFYPGCTGAESFFEGDSEVFFAKGCAGVLKLGSALAE